jgi:hypothetical protein
MTIEDVPSAIVFMGYCIQHATDPHTCTTHIEPSGDGIRITTPTPSIVASCVVNGDPPPEPYAVGTGQFSQLLRVLGAEKATFSISGKKLVGITGKKRGAIPVQTGIHVPPLPKLSPTHSVSIDLNNIIPITKWSQPMAIPCMILSCDSDYTHVWSIHNGGLTHTRIEPATPYDKVLIPITTLTRWPGEGRITIDIDNNQLRLREDNTYVRVSQYPDTVPSGYDALPIGTKACIIEDKKIVIDALKTILSMGDPDNKCVQLALRREDIVIRSSNRKYGTLAAEEIPAKTFTEDVLTVHGVDLQEALRAIHGNVIRISASESLMHITGEDDISMEFFLVMYTE